MNPDSSDRSHESPTPYFRNNFNNHWRNSHPNRNYSRYHLNKPQNEMYRRYTDAHKLNRFDTRFDNNYRKRNFNRLRPELKIRSRETSPVLGSEEYTNRKIQQTSALIMRQLLTPGEVIPELISDKRGEETEQTTQDSEVSTKKPNKNKSKQKKGKTCPENSDQSSYNVKEIHDKIIGHIKNLNDGKKKNLINNTVNVCYDEAIGNIQKKKQLEISRALRYMCSKEVSVEESSNIIDSIIPDLGIKLEELPRNVIEELSNTLNLNFDFFDSLDNGNQVASIKALETYDNTSTSNTDMPFPNQSVQYSNTNTESQNFTVVAIKPEPVESTPEDQYCIPVPISMIKSEPRECSESQNEDEVIEKNVVNENEALAPTIADPSDIYVEKNVVSEMSEQNVKTLDVDIQNIKEEPQEDNIEEVHMDNTSTTENQSTDNTEYLDTVNIKNEKDVTEDNSEIEENETKNVTDSAVEGLDNSNTEEFWQETLHINQEVNFEDPDHTKNPENNSNISRTVETSDKSSQTEQILNENYFEDALIEHFKQNEPQNLKDKVNRMIRIDNIISSLTNYRKSLFENYLESSSEDKRVLKKRKRIDEPTTTNQNIQVSQKGKIDSTFLSPNVSKKQARSQEIYDESFMTPNRAIDKSTQDNSDAPSVISEEENEAEAETKGIAFQKKILEFNYVHKKILAVKAVNDQHLLAASESGQLYYISLDDGSVLKVVEVTTVPITCILVVNMDALRWTFVGAVDLHLRAYVYNSYEQVRNLNVDDAVQCLEYAWDFIFIGCRSGTLARYSVKKNQIKYKDHISKSSILVLKATKEGARRILIVGARNQPVVIRDAMSGLYIRVLDENFSPTVYCLLLEQNLVYCGTTSNNILVISFHEGKLVHNYTQTKFSGVSCLQIVGNLLFAGCMDGNIYVYDTNKKEYIDSIMGQGAIICMEVLENQVIVGTLAFQFKAIPIPGYILRRQIKQ